MSGHWFTLDQFIAYMDEQKCHRCDKKATWLPMDKGIGYCDEHFPYHQEKLKEQKNEWTYH